MEPTDSSTVDFWCGMPSPCSCSSMFPQGPLCDLCIVTVLDRMCGVCHRRRSVFDQPPRYGTGQAGRADCAGWTALSDQGRAVEETSQAPTCRTSQARGTDQDSIGPDVL